MGEMTFSVDPDAIDKEAIQRWIDQLKSLSNIDSYLHADKDISITVTDNKKFLSKANQEEIEKDNRKFASEGREMAGYSQKRGHQFIWINPLHPKPQVKILIHEILHFKTEKIGERLHHDPAFYQKPDEVLRSLGITPDPQEDLDEPLPDDQIASQASPSDLQARFLERALSLELLDNQCT